MKTIFLTYAVKEEYIPVETDKCQIIPLYTGIGKTKSATMLTKNICLQKPDIVINIGTAGTLTHEVGDIFIANCFVDRDYESIKLPGVEFMIDGMELLRGIPMLKNWVNTYPKLGTCSTGDTFVTTTTSFEADVIEMEVYAQAYVCQEFGVPFLSIKYVTDIIGKNSVEHWENKLPDASKALAEWIAQNELFTLLS